MNLRFNSSLSSWIFTLFMPVALSLLLWQILMLSFPLEVKDIEIQQSKNFSRITSLSRLFVSKTSKVVTKKQAPKSQTIRGIILKALYEDENGGFVILQDKKESIFLSLKESYKGYVLEKIESNFIILSKNKKEITLHLDDKKDKTLTKSPTPIINEPKEQIVKGIERKKLKPFQKDIKKLWRNVRLQSYKINSKLNGYRISYVKRGSLFDKIGLKKGDYIQSVNGIDVKDSTKLMQLYLSMDTLESIHLEILRNQEPKDLYYELY